MNRLLDDLNRYLDVIDKWRGQSRKKNVGAYSFLSEDLLVRDIVVCPNVKYGMAGLKTFFVTDALEVHLNKRSDISYKEIQSHLLGKLSKKPKLNYEILEKCGQIEANRNAFLNESRIMKEKKNLCEMVEKCDEWLPYILLDQLRKSAWRWLDKYNYVCEERFCEDCKKREEIYYHFTQAVALFEMFFLEYIQRPIREYVEVGNEMLQKALAEVERLQKKGETKNVEEALSLATEYEKVVNDDLNCMTEILDKISVFSLLEAEFSVELCAMYHLLLILESINVYSEFIDDIDKMQIGLRMDTRIRCDYEKNFRSFGRTNEVRSVSYRRVNEYLEEMLSQYTDSNYDIEKATMEFLEELSKRGKGEPEKYYDLMRRLAYPVYCKLGGNGCIMD